MFPRPSSVRRCGGEQRASGDDAEYESFRVVNEVARVCILLWVVRRF